MMDELSIRQAAYDYNKLHLPVIPLCSADHSGMSTNHVEKCKCPGKAPVLKSWTKHDDTSAEDLDQWFGTYPSINIGLVLGQTKFWNLLGVDIDGALGASTWSKLAADFGAELTWEFRTGNGRRLLYRLPDGIETKKHKVCWKEGHEELAFLTTGQQTVLPPSVHASGTKYEWIEGRSPFDMDIADVPPWIIDLIEVVHQAEEIPNFYGEPVSKPVTALEYNTDAETGSRSNYMTRFVGALCAKRELPKDTVLATAQQQNAIFCKPPLSEEEIVAMVESIWKSEQEKHQKRLNRQRQKEEMNPALMAEKFFQHMLDKGEHWRYCSDRQKFYTTTETEGPWKLAIDDRVETEAQNFLLNLDPTLTTRNKRMELIQAFKLYLTTEFGYGNEFDSGKYPNLRYIAVNNGLLDWQKGTLQDWDVSFTHTAQIHADWDKEAYSYEANEVWEEALTSWLPDESTRMFLQEYIGYALLPSCKMRTAVFLFGEGANGKSLFIDVVLKLFEGSYAVAQPHNLAHRFGTTVLLDKMLAVCSDIDASYLDKTGVLKQVISGDMIRGEYKGGKDFSFTPTCKLLFSANDLPKAADRSYGWYSRVRFVPFKKRFKPDQEYYQNLMDVMSSPKGRSALLMWAIEGLQRLAINKEFTHSEELEKAAMEYRLDNDSVYSFLDEHLEPTPLKGGGYKTSLVLSAVYAAYKEWCTETGVKMVSRREFTVRATKLGYEKKHLKWKTKYDWKTQISLVDVQFKEDTEFEAEQIYKANLMSLVTIAT